jgi:hypothetical protein
VRVLEDASDSCVEDLDVPVAGRSFRDITCGGTGTGVEHGRESHSGICSFESFT